ncbi:MSMEG_6728 family protein [Aquipuribacter sp. MA13-6]|uniref:MSMEG_6728 family protein n=1 Tax=unclassified Aquipuribacter TaxID=2635084 RepID=UPI003EED06AF
MQTFLPYPDERASAAVLDDRRLGKQRVETLQVLRALTWHSYGWRNHPAVRMWRGFVPALVHYGVAVCDEWVSRGRADAVRGSLLEFTGGVVPDPQRLHDLGQRPPWLGLDELHRSHRSSLVRKDPEHYRPSFPDVPDDLPYVWPSAAFPRWPLRRGGARPLTVPAALERLGGPAPPDAVLDALRRLTAGEGVEVASADPEELTRVGLVAGLVTPGSTAWLLPGDEPPVTGPPPEVPDVPLGGSAVSASVARAPQPEDLASVADEVAGAADPDFRFLRVTQLSHPAALDGVGLVVRDPHLAPQAGTSAAVPTLTLRLRS